MSHHVFGAEMKLRNTITLAVSLTMLGLVYTIFDLAVDRASFNIHKTAMAYATRDKFYVDFVKEYFNTYGRLGVVVSVNDTYDETKLNIVIGENFSLAKKLISYSNNFTAVGKNILVIDRSIFDLLLVASSYGLKAQIAKYIFQKRGLKAFGIDVLWAQQFANIKRNTVAHGSMLANEAEKIKDGIVGLDNMSDPPELLTRAFGDPRGIASKLTSIGLGFLIEHEIGHLGISPLRRLWLRLPAYMRLDFAALDKAEEDEADRLSRESIDRLMNAARNLGGAMDETEIERSILFSNFMFFWIDGMFEFFENLHFNNDTIYAEDYLFEVNFSDCYLDSELYKYIPDQVFAMIPVLRNARLRPLPVLTKAEYENLRRYLRQTHNHSHSAVRAAVFLDMLREKNRDNLDEERIGINSTLISAATADSLQGVKVRLSLPLTKISTYAINSLSSASTKQKGYLCNAENCEIMISRTVKVETLATGEYLNELRVTAKWPDAKNEALWKDIIGVSAKATGATLDEIQHTADEIVEMCPGSFRVIQKDNIKELIYFGKNVTSGYITLRILGSH